MVNRFTEPSSSAVLWTTTTSRNFTTAKSRCKRCARRFLAGPETALKPWKHIRVSKVGCEKCRADNQESLGTRRLPFVGSKRDSVDGVANRIELGTLFASHFGDTKGESTCSRTKSFSSMRNSHRGGHSGCCDGCHLPRDLHRVDGLARGSWLKCRPSKRSGPGRDGPSSSFAPRVSNSRRPIGSRAMTKPTVCAAAVSCSVSECTSLGFRCWTTKTT